jgi:RHS repeat-associated protein
MAAKRKSSWLLLLISLVASSALASVPRPDTPLQPLTAADRWELFAETADVDSDQLIRRTGLAWLEPISRLQLPQEEISINEVVPFDAEPRRSLFAVSRELASGPRNPAEENNISDLSELDAESWQGHDYMHARYYSAVLGRFLSVDPAMNVNKITGRPQKWNRFSYVVNNPMIFADPNGREEVVFLDDRAKALFVRLEARNPGVRTTLNRYRQKGSQDLHIGFGDAGIDPISKENRKGVFDSKLDVSSYDYAAMPVQDSSSILEATGKYIIGASPTGPAILILDSEELPANSKLERQVAIHEVGHAESAAVDPVRYLKNGAKDVVEPPGREPLDANERPNEINANEYERRNNKN